MEHLGVVRIRPVVPNDVPQQLLAQLAGNDLAIRQIRKRLEAERIVALEEARCSQAEVKRQAIAAIHASLIELTEKFGDVAFQLSKSEVDEIETGMNAALLLLRERRGLAG